MHEPFLDHPTEDGGIDIAASDNERDAAAGEPRKFACHHGRERHRSRAFNHRFFQFQHAQNRERNEVFAHRYDFVDATPRERERIRANAKRGESIRQRGTPMRCCLARSCSEPAAASSVPAP